MNANLNPLAGYVAATAPQDRITHQVPLESGQPGSFDEHLSFEEVKRPRFKAPSKPKAAPLVPAVKKSSAESTQAKPGTAVKNRSSTKALKNSADPFPAAAARKVNVAESKLPAAMIDRVPEQANRAALVSPSDVRCETQKHESQFSEEARQMTEATTTGQSVPSALLATLPIPIVRSTKAVSVTTEEVKAVTADSSGEAAGSLDETAKAAPSQKRDTQASLRAEPISKTSDAESLEISPLSDSPKIEQYEEQPLPSVESYDSSDLPLHRAVPATTDDDVPQPDGTGAAKQMLPMKSAVEMDEFAGSTVKNLPSTGTTRAIPAVRVISRESQRRDQGESFLSNLSITTTASSSPATPNNHVESISDVPLVERVARTVVDGMAQMRHIGTDSVSVVLKPDSGTELLLRVEMRDGALSAHLHFERGDRALLDQHWNELQRRLAEQGVRLNYGDGTNSQFAQSQHRPTPPENDSSPAGLLPFEPKPVPNHETTLLQTASGFEMWA